MSVNQGEKAPDFTLRTSGDTGKPTDDFGLSDVTLSDHEGESNVVLLFFPAAFSAPCAQEMCSVSSDLAAYGDLDAVVYGISVDGALAQGAWAKQEGISFPLLSDLDKEVVRAYGVDLPDFLGLGTASKRAVFVIDKAGLVRHAEVTPTPLQLPDFDAVKRALADL